MEERKKEDFKKYYDIIDVIGNGAYGFVYKAKEKGSNRLVAIKVMDLDKIRKNFMNIYEDEEIENQIKLCKEAFKNEYENMKICSENNINSVKCYEYFENDNFFVIIMELCDKNLAKLLLERKKNKFNKDEILEIMKQLNKTFKIMSERKILHRDLKLENILIKYNDNKKYIMKISDYGSSKRLISLSRNCNSNIGTTIYMAPEILEGKEYNYKCDLWSIGIIIYKLYYGKSPFLGITEEALKRILMNMIKVK